MRTDRREEAYYRWVRENGPKYAEFELATCDAMVNFAYTYDVVHSFVSRYMAEIGLSKSAFNVLMILRNNAPEGLQLHDLGDYLIVSRANVTGLIDHLEERGLVKRVVDENDRRARFARITKRGEALLDDFVPFHYRQGKEILKDLSIEEKETLARLLTKVRQGCIAAQEQFRDGELVSQVKPVSA